MLGGGPLRVDRGGLVGDLVSRPLAVKFVLGAILLLLLGLVDGAFLVLLHLAQARFLARVSPLP